MHFMENCYPEARIQEHVIFFDVVDENILLRSFLVKMV